MELGSLEVLGKSKLTRSDGLWPCVKVVLKIYNVQCTYWMKVWRWFKRLVILMTSGGCSTEHILDKECSELSPGAPMDGGDFEFDLF